ncbi:MAG: hypothetical protein H0W64_11420 [Gammaproteobacteria bacterium]|nr:hypothetical protein [Gammaproteobacteria bacterium]
MQLRKNAVKKLIGDSHEVVVFGLRDFRYYGVMDALNEFKIKTYSWERVNFPVIKSDEIKYLDKKYKDLLTVRINGARECKSIITSLIIENYKRMKEGSDLIPFIFCIGLKDQNQTLTLDIKKVALSHTARNIDELNDSQFSSVTEKELRRCYKIYAEGTPDVKALIEKTFKFVMIQEDSQVEDLFDIEQIPPFWEDPCWEKYWQQRQLNHLSTISPKLYDWRAMLTTCIDDTNFGHQHNFFRSTKCFDKDKNFKLTYDPSCDDKPISEISLFL